MKLETINKNYYVKMNKCGREGISIEVGNVLGSSMITVIDKKEFERFVKSIKQGNDAEVVK